MSNPDHIPNEATTERLMEISLEDCPGIWSFMNSLDSEQQRRFAEVAHDLIYIGFEAGRKPLTKPSIEQQARGLIRLTTIYLKGAAEGEQTLDEYYGEDE